MYEITPKREAGLLHGPLFRSAPRPLWERFKQNIQIHQDYPEKVIRYDPHPLSTWEIGLETCDLLREQYGFAIPKTQISGAIDFRTANPYIKDASVVAITDRVHGKLLLDVLDSNTVYDPAFISAFTTLCTGAARYLSDICEYGGVYLYDLMHHSQFIFGNTAEDPKQKLYLVDIEPRYRKFTKAPHNSHDLMHLITYTRRQQNFIIAVEESGGAQFEEAHTLLAELSYEVNKCLVKNST
ncbi:MAG: hypothetical protein RLZZ455_725 [Candidatus Parcubacteria bacterium]|jgi:hypothetical protein